MLENVPSEKKLQDVLSKSGEIHSLAKTSERRLVRTTRVTEWTATQFQAKVCIPSIEHDAICSDAKLLLVPGNKAAKWKFLITTFFSKLLFSPLSFFPSITDQ